MAGYDSTPHGGEARPFAATGTRRRETSAPLLLAAASVIGTVIAVPAAQAQQLPVWQPLGPQYTQCPAPGQPLLQIPEIVSQNGKLRGTIVLSTNAQRMFVGSKSSSDPKKSDPTQCRVQNVRQFRGSGAVLPAYAGSIPPGYPGYVPPASYPGFQPVPPGPNTDPVPGPTLRAKLGDIVELALLNQLSSGGYWSTIDRGEKGPGCDQSTAPYPGLDVYPDCFHGSTTGNIHFHGTHTNPGTAGDNVFIEVRPSLLDVSGQPVVTEASISAPFDEFFTSCETELNKSVLSQWPRTWNDFPPAWVATQESLLKQYDTDPVIINKLWPVDEAQRRAGAWPQYYIGATPYCFRLPSYTPPGPSQSAHPANHGAAGSMEQARALQMGQAPGTHWYHAHKHGSTAIDVSNGMTGVFIIEGGYDDTLNQFYGPSWTGPQSWSRSQPVLVVNQLGTSPNLFGGGNGNPGAGPLPFSVNGRFQPALTMQPGQVQLWRIANTSSRGAIFVNGFAPANAASAPSSPQVFTWKQTAQDGVQFTGGNYANSQNPNLLLFAGNRADVLVQAPTAPGQYVLLVQQVRSRCATLPLAQIPTIPVSSPPPAPPVLTPICSPDDKSPLPLLIVNVSGPPATGNQAQLIPADQVQQSFPAFLADIKDSEVKGTRTVVFESTPASGLTPHAMHTIDGHKFDGNVGEVVLLNTVEEWKIVNNTVNGAVQPAAAPATGDVVVATDPPGVVDHPFHIHINPFQISEFFDPNQFVPDPTANNALIPKYVTTGITNAAVQCLLDPNDPTTWKDCHNMPQPDRIWWDVFGIPSARAVFTTQGQNITQTTIPGYFKMRSRFVDYTGQYVLHCHILAHEDRGMMTVVEVVPFTTAYSHK